MAYYLGKTLFTIATMMLLVVVVITSADQKDFTAIQGDDVQHYAVGYKQDSVLKRTYQAVFGRFKRSSEHLDLGAFEAEIEKLKRANEENALKLTKLSASVQLLINFLKSTTMSKKQAFANQKDQQAEIGPKTTSSSRAMESIVQKMAASKRLLNEIIGKTRVQLNKMRSAEAVELHESAALSKEASAAKRKVNPVPTQ